MQVALDAGALGSGRGGDETCLRGILAGLAAVADAGDRIVCYVPRAAVLPPPVDGDARFPVHRLRAAGGMARFAVSLPRLVAASGCDVVLSLIHAPLRLRHPNVLVVPDLSFHHHPEHYPPVVRARLGQLIPRQAARATVVATVSEYCRRDLVDTLGLDPERVRVVSNPIEPPTPLDDAAAAAARARLAARGLRPPFLLYLGNVHPRKNVPRLVRAFRAAARASAGVADHQLVVAGGSWFGRDEEVRQAAAGAGDRVAFVGRVDDDEREVLLGDATALCYPSLFEGFGLPPLEAMARGTAVLASDVSAIPEATGGIGVLVDPTDEQAISDGIMRIVEDEPLRRRLAAAGPARAGTYHVGRTGAEVMAALRLAVAGSGAAIVP